MADKLSIFCVKDPPPTLRDLRDFLSEENFNIEEENDDAEEDMLGGEDPVWTEATFFFGVDKEIIQIECWQEDNGQEFAEFRDELLNMLEGVEEGEIDEITAHISKCSFSIEIIFPDEPDEEGQAIWDALLHYFASEHDGLAYVEGEGIYNSSELILEMD